jgi:serine protease AprX
VQIIPGTSLGYGNDDLSSDGKISLIVSTHARKDLHALRQEIQKSKTAKVTDELEIVRGLVTEVPVADAGRFIQNLPKGTRVAVDSTIQWPRWGDPSGLKPFPNIFESQPPDPGGLSTKAGEDSGTTSGTTLVNGVDIDRADVGLDKVWAQGYTGKGVTVAVIDSGIYPHPDIKDHMKAFVDIADNKPDSYDSYGHGTQVAGSIAGDGKQSHGQIKGAAPGADLVGVRITTVSEAIKGIEWVIANKDKYGIRIINLSLGDTAQASYKDDLWCQAVEKAVKAGIVVCVAAGNEGPDPGSVSTPGIDPNVITVGAVDNKKTMDHSDDQVASFSSRGPTSPDNLQKPDILAPGVRVFGPLSPDSKLDAPEIPHIGRDYEALTGSSQATPIVSGLVADMLQANPNLTPAQVKDIIIKSADHYLKDDPNAQGAGVMNGPAAVKMALEAGQPAVA